MSAGRVNSFAEARKRSARGKAMEVIDVEPLASVDPAEKGEVSSLKRKMTFETPLEGKLMSDAMKITRTSRRLAGMKPPVPGGSGSAGGNAGIRGPIGSGKNEGKAEVYTPYWQVDKHSRLITIEDRRDWVDNLLPPSAKAKFEVYKGEELGSRIDHAIYENVGLLTRVKSELEMRGAVLAKLRQEVGTARQAQLISAEYARKLEVDKIAREMEKEVLEREKEELRKHAQLAGSLGSGEAGVAQWRETAEFWANMGAKIMVRNALCAPEMKEWLLAFATKCTDIGYTEGVTAVYTANRQREKAASFPYYKEGDTDGPEFIDGQITELQSGVIDFEFLRFLEANPGLSGQDLAAVFEQVYPEVRQQESAPVEQGPRGTAEKEQAGVGNESEEAGTSKQVAPEVPEVEAEVEEVVAVTDELREEDPGHARED